MGAGRVAMGMSALLAVTGSLLVSSSPAGAQAAPGQATPGQGAPNQETPNQEAPGPGASSPSPDVCDPDRTPDDLDGFRALAPEDRDRILVECPDLLPETELFGNGQDPSDVLADTVLESLFGSDDEENPLLGDEPAPRPCAEPGAAGDGIVPDGCWGPFPSSHYEIGCDSGSLTDVKSTVYCTGTDWTFQAGRVSTAVSLWGVEWAYGLFSADDERLDTVGNIVETSTDALEAEVIGPLRLTHLAWLLAIAWAANVALRGRLALAGSEIAVSILLAGLAGFILANPSGYLRGAFDTLDTTSNAILMTTTNVGRATGDDTTGDVYLNVADGGAQTAGGRGSVVQRALAPVQERLHNVFVAQPYDELNWGSRVDELDAPCEAARNRILAFGPRADGDQARELMEEANCEREASFNENATAQRFFSAAVTTVSAGAIALLITIIAFTIVVAKIAAIALVIVAPFAALSAILTAGGRRLALLWLSRLLQILLVVMGMSLVLALLLQLMRAVVPFIASAGLIERFAVLNLIVVAMFLIRRSLLSAGAAASTASAALSPAAAAVPGRRTAGPIVRAPEARGVSGFDPSSDPAVRRVGNVTVRQANRVTRTSVRTGRAVTVRGQRAATTVARPVSRRGGNAMRRLFGRPRRA